MGQVNYEKLLPTKPPEELVSWVKSECEDFQRDYIIYKCGYIRDPYTGASERGVICKCTACGGEFFAERASNKKGDISFINIPSDDEPFVVWSGQMGYCRFCDAYAKVIHTSRIKTEGMTVTERAVMSVHRTNNDRIALLGWLITKSIYKNGGVEIKTYPYEAYVAEDRKLIRLTGYSFAPFSSRVLTGKWRQTKSYKDTWGRIPGVNIYPFGSDILVGTSLANSKLDMYLKCAPEVYPVSYCNLYLKHRNIENLIMQGMAAVVNGKIYGLEGYYHRDMSSIRTISGIDWREVKPHKMLGMTKEELQFAVRHGWTADDIDFYNTVKDKGIRLEDIGICSMYGYILVKGFIEEYPSEKIMKVIRYMERQRKRYAKQRAVYLSDLTDYWDMLAKLDEDITDTDIRYPQNLVRAHDTAQERIQFKESEELRQQFEKRTEVLSKYCYNDGELFIRPAASEAELISEGKNLHHCVGGYAKRHAEGGTAIFFIRHLSEPEVSYFTLELDEKNLTVRQNRGLHNCARTDEVKEFEAKWLEFIKKMTKEIKKNGKRNSKAA